MIASLLNWAMLFALIGIVFIIWRSFGRLAELNNRGKWPFKILGIAMFIVGINVGIGTEYLLNDYLPSGSLRVPFGILACLGLYKYLKKRWTALP